MILDKRGRGRPHYSRQETGATIRILQIHAVTILGNTSENIGCTSDEHNRKAHGMDGTLVEADWLPLTLVEVRALLVDLT